MAGGSTSEEMDAFDDVTPPKAVSIYDLDEDLPTRTQSSDEIAEFQKLAREKKASSAFRSFRPPKRDVVSSPPDDSSPSGRPIPRESGPMRIHVLAPEPDLESILDDVAAGIERLPPAPRVPKFEESRATLETIHGPAEPVVAPGPPPRRGMSLARGMVWLAVLSAVALGLYALTVH